MITDVRLQNFRSYDDASFELSPGVNIIVGPNASGKTNLLEALLVLARGSSYRAKDAELVNFQKAWARLDAHTPKGSRTTKLELEPIRKSYEIDGKAYQRLSLASSLPVVLFEPNHLLMLTGGPELRRSYLDELLEQTIVGYSAQRRSYRRVLAQRNRLLKQGLTAATPQIFVWNLRLSELGGLIARHRLELVESLGQHLNQTYRDLSHSRVSLALSYQSSCSPASYESSLLKRLEASLAKDCLVGYTTAGPHRDDLQVDLDGHTASESASRGETRSIVLALKILELELLKHKRGSPPLLLLDDVFSELDGARRQALVERLKTYQTFVTTTDADLVIQHFTDSANIIPIGKN